MSDWSIEREKEAHSQIEALRSEIEGHQAREAAALAWIKQLEAQIAMLESNVDASRQKAAETEERMSALRARLVAPTDELRADLTATQEHVKAIDDVLRDVISRWVATAERRTDGIELFARLEAVRPKGRRW